MRRHPLQRQSHPGLRFWLALTLGMASPARAWGCDPAEPGAQCQEDRKIDPFAPPPARPGVWARMSTLHQTETIIVLSGASLLFVGLYLDNAGRSKESSAALDCIDQLCPESRRSDIDSAQREQRVGHALLLSGGALVLGGVGIEIWKHFSGTSNGEVSRRPTLRIGPLSGSVQGTF